MGVVTRQEMVARDIEAYQCDGPDCVEETAVRQVGGPRGLIAELQGLAKPTEDARGRSWIQVGIPADGEAAWYYFHTPACMIAWVLALAAERGELPGKVDEEVPAADEPWRDL